MAFFLLLYLASAEYLEYRFSKNFGDIFFDYSMNYRLGLNGREIGTDDQDTLPTDRGAYFGSTGLVTIPEENNLGVRNSLYLPCSVVSWIYIIEDFKHLKMLQILNSELLIDVFIYNLSFFAEINQNNITETSQIQEQSTIGLEKTVWSMIEIKLLKDQVQVFINDKSIFSFTYSSTISLDRGSIFLFGKPYENSFTGFLWNFLLSNSSSHRYSNSVKGCPNGIIEKSKAFCLPENIYLNQTASGAKCPDHCLTCSFNACLSCNCSFNSCEISEKSECICPDHSKPTETSCECLEGFYQDNYFCKKCEVENCEKCLNSSTCEICEAGFLSSDFQCRCRKGFRDSGKECVKCSDKCLRCNENKCVECIDYFFSGFLGCEPCGMNCLKCERGKCLVCRENYVVKSNEVDCDCTTVGYNRSNDCKRNRFSAELEVIDRNVFKLKFSESVSEKLIENDFNFRVKGVKNPEVAFENNGNEYVFRVFSKHLIEDGIFEVSIQREIVSDANALYLNKFLVVQLVYWDPFVCKLNEIIVKVTEIIIYLSLALAGICLVFGNALFYSLFNSLQMISFIPLNGVDYSPYLIKIYLNSNVLVHFSGFFGNENSGSDLYKEANRYGIKTEVFILNICFLVIQFILNIVILVISYLLAKLSYNLLKNTGSKIYKLYKYSYFIRFFTACSLDLGIFSLIQLIYLPAYSSSSSFLSTLSIILSSIVIVILLLFPFIIMTVSYLNKARINNPSDFEFSQTWGALYRELKYSNNILNSQYYTIFMIRRLLFIFNQIFLSAHPLKQSLFNILGSLFELLYILVYFPFEGLSITLSKILFEITFFFFELFEYFTFKTKVRPPYSVS